MEHILIAEDLRSIENVGAMFRLGNAVAVQKIILVGTSPCPIDRFGRVDSKFAKTALGAEKTIPWEYCKTITEAIDACKATHTIAAVEQSPKSIPYTTYDYGKPTAFIFGAEVAGVSQEVLDKASVILELPMHGTKESLNVAMTAGIVMYKALEDKYVE